MSCYSKLSASMRFKYVSSVFVTVFVNLIVFNKHQLKRSFQSYPTTTLLIYLAFPYTYFTFNKGFRSSVRQWG